MLFVIYFASRHVVRRFTLAARDSVSAGLLSLALLLATELVLAVAISGRTISGYFSGRDPVSGTVYFALVLLYALLPWLHAPKGGSNQ
ncbi:MAG TPA: hypothetical protein VI216_05940 [Candidatus Acidoferrales bacterium]